MRNFKKLLLLCFLFLCGLTGNAQITTGDIAIIGFNGGNNPAELAIVTLSAISSGQTIYITDRGWHPTSGFATANTTAEGLLAWTITTEIPAGTVLKASITAGPVPGVTGLSDYGTASLTGWSGSVTAHGGDNWFIYTGSETSPSFTYAFANWATNSPGGSTAGTSWQTTDNVNATTSYLPPILATGNFSVAFTGSTLHGDYIHYTGDVIGSKDQILANLAGTNNWDHNETTPADLEPGGADFPGTNPIFQLPPSVVSISSSTADGSYKADDIISIQVNFSNPVVVTGTPQLVLNTGGTAQYASSNGSTLNFNYTIAAGENAADLDYAATTSLSGGTIKDAAGNNALLTLPTPGAAGSLGAIKAIIVDTDLPTLAITSNVPTLKIGETATITFTFSEEPGATFSITDIIVSGGTLPAISGSGLVYTGTFTPTANATGTASITVAAGNYTDVAGNGGTAGTTPALTFDTEAPEAPVTPVLASASDSGISSTDQITKVTTPVLTGAAEAGTTVTLYDTDGATVLGTAVATGGIWSITSAALSEGAHTLTVKAKDVAGNTSQASEGLSISIDTTAPTLVVTSDVSSLKMGETATITFTFSEDPSTTFTWDGAAGDVVITGGTLTAISGAGLTRAAIFTPTANATGTASITVAAGSYTDVAGNNGGAGLTPALSFDTEAPSVSTPVLAAASDSGTSSTDQITRITTPIIIGTAEAGATVTVYDTDGTTVLGTTVATGGNWSITILTLSSGTHTLTAKATDAAGNTSQPSAGLTITIDTTAPTLAITSDVATLVMGETANITFTFSEDPTTTFTWNGTNGDVVVTGGTLAAISGSGLTRTAIFTPTANAVGTASITVAAGTYTDVAGNNGEAGTTPVLTYNTQAPAAPATPVLASTSDSGTSSTDRITNVTTPIITGTAEAGATVTLYDTDGITVLGTAVATGGNWSITSSTLSSGAHILRAKATNTAGTSLPSTGLTITIDTTAPTLAITSNVPALKIGETANITFTFSEDPSTTFSWNGTNGDVVVTGGTLAAISGSGLTRTATFTPTADASGTASITVAAGTYTDVAGNNGEAGITPALTFDTQAPAAPATPVLAATSDLGFSDTDNITNVINPEITGTAEAGATVTLYATDGTTVLGTAVATSGNWSITSSTLSSGAHTLTAKATDAAGNTGVASAGLTISIDTTAPTLAITSNVPALKIGETANITFNFSEDPETTFSWNGTNGDVVVTGGTLAAISGSGLTRTATFTPTADASGTASITVAAGTYTDVAGNNGGAGITPVLSFDTQAPATPATPVLAATSDLGFSDTDNITNVTNPIVTGTAETGATVILYDTDGTTILGTAVATAGNWSITTSALSEGTHTLTAKATDAAGNTSAASAGLTISIDTTAPTLAITSNVPALKIGETATITFTFSEDPSTTFSWNGTNGDVVVTGGTLAAISGSGLTRSATFTPTADASGTASITVAAGAYTDVAGNNGEAGITPALTFDTQAPAAPATPVLAATSDLGFSDTDNITNVINPIITGTAEAGATVTLYATDGTTILGTAVATGGNWSITSSTLSSGAHTLTAKATDAAGNTGAASAGLTISIDTTAPTLAITSNVPALKIGETANITFTFSEDPETTFSWNGTNGDVVVTGGTLAAISGSGLTRTATFTPTADASGTASITVAAGTYTDVAGNNGEAGITPALTFDTQAPAAPATPVLAATSDLGFSDTDNITNVTNPEITGTAEAGTTVTLYDTDGTTVLGTAVATSGNWSITSSTLSSGAHTLTAKATDAAGNTGVASAGLTISIDTTAPTLAITSNVPALKIGETATITFTFSEDPETTFSWNGTNGDVVVTGGTLAAISGSGLTRSATFTPTANASGTASITVAAGAYTDVAGNNGEAGITPALTFDTQAPAAPATPVLAATSDFGFSDTDNITNVTNPIITGTAEVGATVTLYDTDGTTILGTAVATAGNWSITSSTLSSGAHTLTAKATDAAGNTSAASAGLTISIDTTAPTLAITSNVPALKIGETANITFTFSEDPETTFSWNGTNGDVVVTGGTLAAISGSGLIRSATFTPTANTAGTASITVAAGTYTDVAGNNGGAGITPALTFDTQAPAAPATPVLAATSDLGFSDTDNITNVTNPIITGTAEAGATVILYDTDGTTILGTAVATSGNWSITSSALSEGTHTLTAKATDAAGNTSAASTGLTISIDTTAPTLAITSNVPALKIGETANITFTFSEDPETTFSWNGTNGDVVVTGGTLAAISGSGLTRTATFTPTASAAGTASITVAAGTYTDVAGNNGGAGITPALTFDTQAPAAPATPVLAATSDLGFSDTDNITNVTNPIITGTAEAGATVTLYDTDGTTVLGTTVATGGNWSITSSTLSSGAHTLTAKATDVAGNTGVASAGLTISIDTTAPTLAITSNVPALKIGETATITFTFSEDPSTTFSWNGTNGDVVVTGGTLAAISGSGLTRTATFTPTASAAGTASITVAAGTYTDVAGNNGGAGITPALTFDTQAPAAPATPVLAATSDFGFSDTDNITNVTNPIITGTAEVGATVTLYDTDGTTLLGTAVATAGNWSITSSTLSSGAHTLTAKATDAAGNTSAASAGLTISIDTTAPTLAITSNVPALKIGETANITFTFSEDPETTFSWNGTNGDVVVTGGTLAAISGSGLIRSATFTPTANTAGTASITVAAGTYTDVAGNNGGAGITPALTFDTQAPAAPATPVLAATSDLGFSDTDNITNVTNPIITGTAEAGTTVTLYDTDGTTVLGTAVATAGNWSITTSALSEGAHTLTAKATDAAGNTSAASAGLAISIDTTAPTLAITSNVPALKIGETANITFTFSEDPSSTFSWNGTNGDVVVTGGTLAAISGSGLTRSATFTPTTDASGTASITVAAGTYTDVAGNNGGAGITPALTFDTEAATLASVNIVSNNPVVTLAKVGDQATLTFTSSETLQTPQVEIAGHLVVATAAGNNWTANYIFTNTDPEGPVAYKITFKDLAGNDGIPVSTGTGAITFDRTAPAVPTALAATPGDRQIELNWSANTESDLAKYRILYGTSANPTLLLTDIPAGTTTYTHSGLTNGTTYYYVIQAIDKTGNMGAVGTDVTAVPKADQTITFNAITAKTYGDASFQLGNVNSSAGLPLTYTAADPSIISIIGNTATILKAGSTMITASQPGNGSFNPAISVQQNLTVNTTALTVTTVSRNKVYGDLLTESDFTGNITGLVNGDNITATRNSTGAGVTATVNTYSILATLVDPNNKLSNYSVNNTAGILTVTKKPLTIAATAQNKTYGDAFNFAGTEFTPTGLINGNTVTSVNLSSAGASATATVLGSPYAIVPSAATGAELENYAITYTNSVLTVNRKAITITAEDKEKFEGTPNPELTVKYSAFANGETNLVFTAQPNITTTATTNSPIGNYPITASGAAAANYSFSYVPGQLKIKPGAPTSITLAGVTLYENSAAGTNAGTLSSTSDAPGATYTFTLVSGTGDTDNSLFAIAGNKINTASALDFESKATYSVRVRSTTQYGLSLEKVLTIALSNVNEIPTLAAIGNQTICFTTATQTVSLTGITAGPDAGQTTTLSVSSNNPGLFGSLNVTGTGATGTLSYRVKAGAIAGTATVTVTVKDDGGTDNGGFDTYSRTFVITVNALPVVAINSNKGTEISKGDQVLLSATGGTSYVWAAHGSIIGGLNSATIEVRPRETTTYTVTATNASGCSESKTFTLTVLEDFQKIKATNILSPNNDGYNDKWIVDNIDFYPNNEVKIFDKAGRLIYGKKGYDNSWDGTFNGTPLAEGTYYYIIDFGTRQRVFKGFITIVKND